MFAQNRVYYLDSQRGNDSNPGNQRRPWKTIEKLNSVRLKTGDRVYLKAGQTFEGPLQLTGSGTQQQPVVITTSGSGKAIIDAGKGAAVLVRNAGFLNLQNLDLRGKGRKDGNTADGVVVSTSRHISLDNLNISGFQHSGLRVESSSNVRITHVNAHNNGFAGIFVTGNRSKTDCQHIYIGQCRAENNPGDPTVLTNHSGNGILVGLCSRVLIEYCAATNNGWDMPRKGNGPVGIWAYEADSVVIQHCLSYRNKTSVGGEDGGGFDLDGGVTNSVIQYCLSYENQGSGFGLFQYAGASPWFNNTIRYNISENDGTVSAAKAGIYVWNAAGESDPIRQCYVYNNVIYNEKVAAIRYSSESAHRDFNFYNNVLVARDPIITGNDAGDGFAGNNWWSLTSGFHANGAKDFKSWAQKTGKEVRKGQLVGINSDPKFLNPGQTKLTSPSQLKTFRTYRLPEKSPLRKAGLDLKTEFGIEPGPIDFNQKPAPAIGIGASF
ncbi:hypothetical protein GCM10027299_18200 [Larkinella ripae]